MYVSRVKKRKGLIAAVVFVALAVAGVIGFRGKGRSPEVKYSTAKVEQGAVTAKVTATGTLSALVTVQVGSQVSGRVKDLFVDFNSPVKKGQVIARIDPQLFEAAAEQARANYAVAQGNLVRAKVEAADAQRTAERTHALVGKNLISQQEDDQAKNRAEAAKAQVVAAEAQVQQARAAMHQAQINLGYTTIVSPIDGVVISRSVDVGQTVAASLQAPTLFTIAEDLKKMQVDTNVAEADVGKLRPGMAATFTVDAYPSERFSGTVRQIRNAPQTLQNVVTYDAVIDVDNPDLRLKPGMTATVTFVYAEKQDVVKIPNAALRFRPPPELAALQPKGPPARGDQRLVWALKGPTPQPLSIKIGITDGTFTELVDGALAPGDALVTDAQTRGRAAGTPPMRRGF